jgi:hypothetical protein
MSQFEIPPAQTQFNNDAAAETWYEVVNTGGYLKDGVEMDVSVNAAALGFLPMFAVKTDKVFLDGSGLSSIMPSPGNASKASNNTFFAAAFSTLGDELPIDPTRLDDLALLRGFNNAGDNLVPGGSAGNGYFEVDEDATYRFTVNAQFTPDSGILTGSAIGLSMVVRQNNGTGTPICPVGHVEMTHADTTRRANRASFSAELALKQGDRVFLAVTWIYSNLQITINKILWTCAKLTSTAPPTLVPN